MASLQGLAQSLKKRLLDSTTLDEKFGAGVNRVKTAFRQDPSQFFFASPTALNRQKQTFQQLSQGRLPGTTGTIKSPVIRAIGGLGSDFSGSMERGSRNISQGISQIRSNPVQGVARTVLGTAQFLQAPASITPPNIARAGVSGLLSGGINSFFAKRQWNDPAQAFGQGFGQGARLSTITKFTDPITGSVASKLSPIGKSFLGRQLITRGVTGVGNVIEDKIIDKVDQKPRTRQDDITSFLIGGAVGGNDEIIDLLKKSKAGELTESAVQKVLEKGGESARRLNMPVNQLEFDPKTQTSRMVSRPVWQWMLKDQTGAVGADTPEYLKSAEGDPFFTKKQAVQNNVSTDQFYTKQQPIDMTDDEANRRVVENIVEEDQIPKVKRFFNSILNPLKNAPQTVQDTMNTWRRELLLSKQKANAVIDQFNISEKDGFKLMQYVQNPTEENAVKLGLDATKYSGEIQKLRFFYDQTRQRGISSGLDINYLDNYLNQVWKESPEQIQKMVRGAGGKPGFVNERSIPSYEEGVKLGLTPKFTNPAQLASHYQYQLERAFANKKMVDDLVKSDVLLPANKAPSDWKTIEAPFFPKVTMQTANGTMIVDYKAPPNVATVLNNIFGDNENDVLAGVAKGFKAHQQINLTGGLPGTPLNSFTIGNAIKEITSGRIVSPIASFLTSMNKGWSDNYFKQNQQYLEMMASEGININTTRNYDKVYRNILDSKTLKDKLGDWVSSAFDKPTFERFLPQIQVRLFKDTFDSAVKGGMDEESARLLAGNVTKNFYGLEDAFSRSKNVDNALSIAFFAPKFRESMINFWIKNVQSIDPRNIRNAEFNMNRRFLAGSIATLLIYDQINKQLNNGRSMFDNKTGKELSLEVPTSDGRSLFIPILPSISTIPRRVQEGASALAGGDIAKASERASTFLSSPIQLGSQMLSNETFYGGKIYDQEDPALTKVGKTLGYGLEQSLPGPAGAVVALKQGRKSPSEAIVAGLELPAYPSKSTNEANLTAGLTGGAWKKYNDLKKIGNIKVAKTYAQTKLQEAQVKKRLQKSDPANEVVDNTFYFLSDSGDLKSIDLNFTPKQPQLTGSKGLDAKLITKYKGEITSKANDIRELYLQGQLTADEAEQELIKLENMRPKKAKKVRVKSTPKAKVPVIKSIKSQIRTTQAQLPKVKVSLPKKTNVKILSNNTVSPSQLIRLSQPKRKKIAFNKITVRSS